MATAILTLCFSAATALGEDNSEKEALFGRSPGSGVALRQTGTILVGSPYLEYAISPNGNYTARTVAGNPDIASDDNQTILYGHPTPGSGAVSLRVDGNVTWNYGSGMIGTVVQAPAVSGTTTLAAWISNGIRLEQSLSIVDTGSGREDTLLIQFTLRNEDSVSHQAGVRLFWDTYLGYTDGVPFRAPGIGDISTEREYTGGDVPQFFLALDNLTAPAAQVQATLKGGAAVIPDRMVFGRWDVMREYLWDYVPTPGANILSDSGVFLYWDPVLLQRESLEP